MYQSTAPLLWDLNRIWIKGAEEETEEQHFSGATGGANATVGHILHLGCEITHA